ncbi:MAG TPA: hypothetical protein VNV16_09670, partial [Methylibium sp.]|nr:hypothetical protein [Methylibium sp.]
MSAQASAAPPRRGGSSAAALGQRLREYLPALVVLFGGVVIWELLTAGPGRRVLPAPSVIGGAFGDSSELLLRAAASTYFEALGGLAIGTLAGIVVAFATARWITARDALLPLAIAANSIPIIA